MIIPMKRLVDVLLWGRFHCDQRWIAFALEGAPEASKVQCICELAYHLKEHRDKLVS